MQKMTPEERITYTLGMIRRDMHDMELLISNSKRDLERARLYWWIAVILASVSMIVVFVLHNQNVLPDVILGIVVLTAFISVRVISYRAMELQLLSLTTMYQLYDNLAQDETLHTGFALFKAIENHDTEGIVGPTES